MDQHFVAGIGNYIKCEALYYAKVHPESQLKDLSAEKIAETIMQAQKVAKLSLKYGGNTIRDYVDLDGNRGTFAKMLQVYGQTKDPELNDVIRIKTSDGRTTHMVPRVQGSIGIPFKIDKRYEKVS